MDLDFLDCVPAAVRADIESRINDHQGVSGWASSIADLKQLLGETEAEIEKQIASGRPERLDELRREKARKLEVVTMMEDWVDCLSRLGSDPRMRGAYGLLESEFHDDEKCLKFIHSAFEADVDYADYLERLQRVKDLRDKIAGTAATLAKLLREIAMTGLHYPPGFSHVSELLRQACGGELELIQRIVLGDPPGSAQTEVDDDLAPDTDSDPEEPYRHMLRYAWRNAPRLPELLDTLAEVAKRFDPRTQGLIGYETVAAAIGSRKHNGKMEYLRAFGYLLINKHGFNLTSGIKNAMATTAIVAINQNDIDVSYDDVRQALDRLGTAGYSSRK